MATETQVREALHGVLDPEIGKPIDDLGMVAGVTVEGGVVSIDILLTTPGCPLKDRIESDVAHALSHLEGIDKIQVRMGSMNGEQREALVQQLRGGRPETPQTFFTDGQTEVIAVASGKGGVGKSSVTANLAAAMAAHGKRVGVLDADVWGFSIPRMLGVHGTPVAFNDMILPLESHGVKVISMGFFVPDENPVIWRGPMLHKALQQFLGDVYWGELDYLLMDLPPGTGDVSLSLASFVPGSSMLVVTTPQDAARKVAERAGRMAQHPNVRMNILGVIENMAGFACPHCGEITDVFGVGGGRATAEALGTDFLGGIPMQVSLREGSDTGTPVVVSEPSSPAGEAFRELAEEIVSRTSSKVGKALPLSVAPRG
ncbi:MAG TPA: Mrp/NBP35 family ATP-binding protein [Actinomycetota bacterium]|nr:Mrp/NBP35 family ATP-binding protein [Actinomycetota bacterium]